LKKVKEKKTKKEKARMVNLQQEGRPV